MPTKFIPHDIPFIDQVNGPEGRRYQTPEGNLYPSVTTVLGSASNKYLEEWRLRVGEAEADKISAKACARGTKIHEACEWYLLGKSPMFSAYQQDSREMFLNMRPYLDRFTEIHALEKRMWSDQLRVAGTVDCIARIGNCIYVIDFKTSGRFKARADIDSYFIQAAVYAVMFYERTGIVISKTKILISTQDNGVLEYDDEVKPWIPAFIELRKNLP